MCVCAVLLLAPNLSCPSPVARAYVLLGFQAAVIVVSRGQSARVYLSRWRWSRRSQPASCTMSRGGKLLGHGRAQERRLTSPRRRHRRWLAPLGPIPEVRGQRWNSARATHSVVEKGTYVHVEETSQYSFVRTSASEESSCPCVCARAHRMVVVCLSMCVWRIAPVQARLLRSSGRHADKETMPPLLIPCGL